MYTPQENPFIATQIHKSLGSESRNTYIDISSKKQYKLLQTTTPFS